MAVTISTAYENALRNGLRESRAYITNINKSINITDNNEIISIKIYSELQKNNNIFGNTIAKYVEIEVKNTNNLQFNDWLDNSIEIYLGLSLNGTPEYINQGRFRIYNIEFDRDKQTAKLECFDAMVKFNKSYSNGNTVFPITLSALFSKIVTDNDLIVGNTVFPNSTFSIEKPNVGDEEFTYRQILGWIAEMAGGNALIGRDGKVYIKTFGATPVYAIDAEEYFALEEETSFGPIQKVRIIRELEDVIEFPENMVNAVSFDIFENPIAYDQREEIIENIYNVVDGISYKPFKLQYRGTGHLDFCDKINIVNSSDQIISSYVMNSIITFDGSMSEELSAFAYAPSSSEIKSQGTVNKKTNYTSAKVDKVENQINLIASTVGTLDGRINEAEIALSPSSIISTVRDSSLYASDLAGVASQASTLVTQTATSWTTTFNTLQTKVNTLEGNTEEQYEELIKYVRFVNGTIELGNNTSQLKLTIENNQITFKDNGTPVAYISNNTLYITNGQFLNSLRIGSFAFTPRTNGSLSFGGIT